MVTGGRSRTKPLSVFPGAAYACHGDGLCCTDVHVLGPLVPAEARALRKISPAVLVGSAKDPDGQGPALRTTDEGACVFLGRDRCELHAALGAAAKPSFCQRFPLFLTATPAGGRIASQHRCPCRTVGPRPPLEAERAAASLRNAGGRLHADHRVPSLIPVGRKGKATFEDWLALEERLLAGIRRGEGVAATLEVDLLPALRGPRCWKDVEAELFEDADDVDTRFGAAMAWFAHGLRRLRRRRGNGGKSPPFHRRPWAPAFDRAEARGEPTTDRAEDLIREWVAESIWSMAWAEASTFHVTRHDLAIRSAVAWEIARTLLAEGVRPDRAGAEALTVVELVGTSDWWGDVVEAT